MRRWVYILLMDRGMLGEAVSQTHVVFNTGNTVARTPPEWKNYRMNETMRRWVCILLMDKGMLGEAVSQTHVVNTGNTVAGTESVLCGPRNAMVFSSALCDSSYPLGAYAKETKYYL